MIHNQIVLSGLSQIGAVSNAVFLDKISELAHEGK